MFSEDTDKVYFRKKDEVSDYAEFMFKAKILLNKKWVDCSSPLSRGEIVDKKKQNEQ